MAKLHKLRIVVDGNGKFRVQYSRFGLFWGDFGTRMNAYAESWRPDVYESLTEAKERLEQMRKLELAESNAKCLRELERFTP